jgi:hypothetical protein
VATATEPRPLHLTCRTCGHFLVPEQEVLRGELGRCELGWGGRDWITPDDPACPFYMEETPQQRRYARNLVLLLAGILVVGPCIYWAITLGLNAMVRANSPDSQSGFTTASTVTVGFMLASVAIAFAVLGLGLWKLEARSRAARRRH